MHRSVLIEHFKSGKYHNPLKTGVAYVYLDFKDQSQQTTKNLIGAIVKQLLWPLPIPERIEKIWREYQYQTASIEQATEMLCGACNAFTDTYICIDALDECKDQGGLLKCFTEAHSKVASIRLICTRRPPIRSIINSRVPKSYIIPIKACESDVRAFAEWRIEDDRRDNPTGMNEDLKKKIIEKLLETFHGMFVDASCAEGVQILTSLQISSACALYRHCPRESHEKGTPKGIKFTAIKS